MSYLEHFKLREQPFRLTPDPAFVYWSKQHSRAKAYMESTIWLADGFVVITGEIGSGKTTLLQSFLEELDDSVVYAVVSQTQLTATEFLQAALTEFGFKPFEKRKVELLDMLNMFLIEQYTNDKKVVLIIDEAQNLSLKVLEEIRMLSNIETHKEKVLRIILAGQPELREKLDSPKLKQLAQRVRLRFHLGALDKQDTRSYINHRLQVAGAGSEDLIHRPALCLRRQQVDGWRRRHHGGRRRARLGRAREHYRYLRAAAADREPASGYRVARHADRGADERRNRVDKDVPAEPCDRRPFTRQRDLHQEQVRQPPPPAAGLRRRRVCRRRPE
jgi:type II secretory pathway predicted ATPase ExeA